MFKRNVSYGKTGKNGETAQQDAEAAKIIADCVEKAKAIREEKDFEVDAKAWQADKFLQALIPLKKIAEALLRPVEKHKQEGDSWDLAFCRALGLCGSRDAVCELLFGSNDLRGHIVDQIWGGLQALARAERVTGAGLHAKFEADAKFTMAFASVSQFFEGLEEMVGVPDVKVNDAMEHEHCSSQDSNEHFTSGNYGVRTTSAIEWFYVSLNESSPPSDPVKLASGSTVSLGLQGVWPVEDPAMCQHPRKPFSQEAADQIFEKINARLQGMELLREEFIGARLYTGPMFEKYNTVLRGGAMNMTDSQPSFLKHKFETLCWHNYYTTTIHAISSAIIKLSKLTPSGAVYRGFAGGMLPKELLEEDHTHRFAGDTARSVPSAPGPSWVSLGVVLGVSWAVLGPSWALLGHLVAIWAVFGVS